MRAADENRSWWNGRRVDPVAGGRRAVAEVEFALDALLLEQCALGRLEQPLALLVGGALLACHQQDALQLKQRVRQAVGARALHEAVDRQLAGFTLLRCGLPLRPFFAFFSYIPNSKSSYTDFLCAHTNTIPRKFYTLENTPRDTSRKEIL